MEKNEKTVAVICEYNPFHHGHKYQIDVLKQSFSTLVGIMSGPFVQRGEVAVADKYSRAAAAIEGGLNAVVELPFPYCVASGGDFATAGVRLASALGVDALAFGCEDEGETVLALGAFFAEDDTDKRTAALIKADPTLSYPRARVQLVREALGDAAAKALSKPNNTLGAEYAAAVYREDLPLKLYPVKRNMAYESATQIRAAEDICTHIPYPAFFARPPRRMEYMERALLASLRAGVDPTLYCLDSTLAAVIKKAARSATTLEELVEKASGKVYTAARIRRAIVAAWLGIRQAAVKALPCYTNLLGADKVGRAFLKSIKKTAALPIITKPGAYKTLGKEAATAYTAALAAEEAAALCEKQLGVYTSPLTVTPYIR